MIPTKLSYIFLRFAAGMICQCFLLLENPSNSEKLFVKLYHLLTESHLLLYFYSKLITSVFVQIFYCQMLIKISKSIAVCKL